MSTDDFNMHTFSIREVQVHPVVHTVLLIFHTKGDTLHIASAALAGFWKVLRGNIMCLRCQGWSLYSLALSLVRSSCIRPVMLHPHSVKMHI